MTQQSKTFFTTWSMWLLATFFYAYQYILRVLPNIMMSDIQEKFHMSAKIFGQYSGFYYIGYAAMHIPIGILLDRFGPKRVLPLCIILTSFGLLPLLFAEHWMFPVLGRFLIGMGSSAAILGVFKIIRMAFAENKFTLMLGFSVTIGLLGAIYGGQPVNYLMHVFNWQQVLEMLIAIGMILAIATFWIIPESKSAQADQSWMSSVKAVLCNPTVMTICLLAGCMVGPLEGFADVWAKKYLESVYQLNDSMAAFLPSLMFLGMCFGCPTLSWFAEKTKAYYGSLILSGCVMSGAFILLLTGQLSIMALIILFIVVGIFCAYQILAIYLASTYVSERLVGLTTACANMIIMAFGYVFHSLIGQITTRLWDGQTNLDGPVYSAQDYTGGLIVIPIGLIIGTLGFVYLMIKLNKPQKVLA